MANSELLELCNKYFEIRNGKLYWKTKPSAGVKIGDAAGCVFNNGYLLTKLKGKSFLNHRLIFLMVNGFLPDIVDHIDGNTLNNLPHNLREATKSQNLYNCKKYSNNTSGIKGISLDKKTGKWLVNISSKNKQYYFGEYEDIELAELVVQEAREKLHGIFACNGIR